jgi:hypothetical protein
MILPEIQHKALLPLEVLPLGEVIRNALQSSISDFEDAATINLQTPQK